MPEDKEIQRMEKEKTAETAKSRNEAMDARGGLERAKPIELTDSTFADELSRHTLMVVDFWAPWCGPCRMVGPVIEQLASEYASRVTFGKLNVDKNPVVSNSFGIQSIPTILVFKNGQPVDGLLGAVPKAFIEGKIKPHLKEGDSSSSSVTVKVGTADRVGRDSTMT